MKLANRIWLGVLVWMGLKIFSIMDCRLEKLMPKIAIGVLVRNKAFVLPYFFYYLENLNYNKNRIGIIIYEDHSVDNSGKMVKEWCNMNRNKYAFINCLSDENPMNGYDDELSSTDWSKNRMKNVIRLREKILTTSKLHWSDYLFMVDADVMITNKNILKYLMNVLIRNNEVAVAPRLNCTSLPFYSNFWDNITFDGFYVRTERYLDIKNSIIKGTFKVALIHSAILFDLNHLHSEKISFNQQTNSNYSNDDLINFAMHAKRNNISLLINNEYIYGYFSGPIQSNENGYYLEKNTFINLLFHFFIYHNYSRPTSLRFNRYIKRLEGMDHYKNIKINVDEIFVINLERRKNRNSIIKFLMKTMDVNFRFFPAIDGKNINETYLLVHNITQLKGYIDPFFKRTLKYGEIGCFLSHFLIWKDMVKRNLSRIIILEDDIKCTSEFPFVVNDLLDEADRIYPEWEYFYLGRKRMSSEKEYFINGSKHILIPNYSYRTTGYVLKRTGALKLLTENPLGKMIALDEYVPIMYGKSPHEEWLVNFHGHGLLKAIACYPVVIQPSHFKGESEHFSDTEDSDLLNQ